MCIRDRNRAVTKPVMFTTSSINTMATKISTAIATRVSSAVASVLPKLY